MPPRFPGLLFWVAAAAFGTLTGLVATGVPDGIDRAVLDFCRDHHHGWLATSAQHFTDVLSPAVDAAILGVGADYLALSRRRPRPFLVAAATGWAMATVVLVTKDWVGRPLPDAPVAPDHGGGFPSGHTAAFLVCFGALAIVATTRRTRARRLALGVVGGCTLLVAACLVYDGFHWLSDTLGSMALGVALLSLLERYLALSRSRDRHAGGA
jgi:membrane-associated phospholipid phosphatase